MMEIYIHGLGEYVDPPSVRALDEHSRVRVTLKQGFYIVLSTSDARSLGKRLLTVAARLEKEQEARELASRQIPLFGTAD